MRKVQPGAGRLWSLLVPVLLVEALLMVPSAQGEDLLPAALSFNQEAELTLPTLGPSSLFGLSASLSSDGNMALVGAPGGEACAADPQLTCHAAYVFVRAGGVWTLETRLTVPGAGSTFGDKVALSGDGNVAFVRDQSLPCPLSSGLGCGGVFVFARNGGSWALEATLLSPTFADFEFFAFGSSLALSEDGSTGLVGKNGEDCVHQPCRGAVYVFTRGAGGVWTQEARFVPSGAELGANFGFTVALSGDGNVALVGSPASSCAAGPDCGAAFAFLRSGGAWGAPVKLTASDPERRDGFGSSVSLSADGTVAAIGEPNGGILPTSPASVYTFLRQGGVWTERQKLNVGVPGDTVGYAVSLSGDGQTLLVGGQGADCAAGTECGMAYSSGLRFGTWTSPQVLTRFETDALGGFVVALSADGATALVAAPRTPCSPSPFPGSTCGAVRIFALAPSLLEIPVLDGLGLSLLALLLAASGALLLARRRSA